jgi:hypothetical protein
MEKHIANESHSFEVATFPSGRSRFVAASFTDVDDARDITRSLESHGYESEQISVFMSDSTRYGYLQALAPRPEASSALSSVRECPNTGLVGSRKRSRRGTSSWASWPERKPSART